jgi:hypothetical protein
MSYTWATTSLDDEPRDVHPLSCAVWESNDPCTCAALTTAELLDRIHPQPAGETTS